MTSDLSALCIRPDNTLREAIACIDRNKQGIVLVVDEERRLLDTITDGDIRRAALVGMNLDLPVHQLQSRRANSPYPAPVTASVGTPSAELLRLMQELQLRQMPLLDENQRVIGLVTLRELLPNDALPLQAVIMAGGFGSRMRPLTDTIPKAMLPIGEKPLLELVLQQLKEAGIREVNVATHYKEELIRQHFGTGDDFGVDIRYVNEDQPLGTAGALSLLAPSDKPLLVINGDILTHVDFHAMLHFHQEHKADMTVAVRQQEIQVPYGVVETDGVVITGVEEKPLVRHFINAGIYLLNPDLCGFIPQGQLYNMTDLIHRLLAEGRRLVSFPIREYWLDIGHMENYQKAIADTKSQTD